MFSQVDKYYLLTSIVQTSQSVPWTCFFIPITTCLNSHKWAISGSYPLRFWPGITLNSQTNFGTTEMFKVLIFFQIHRSLLGLRLVQ